jgi:hypothetical protein
MLNAGDMDREIVLETAVLAQNQDTGEAAPDWATATQATVWAQWLPAGSREAWQAQQRLGAYVDGVFRIYDLESRPSPTLTRVLFQGRTFDVKPWVEIGRGEGLELPVVARADD